MPRSSPISCASNGRSVWRKSRSTILSGEGARFVADGNDTDFILDNLEHDRDNFLTNR